MFGRRKRSTAASSGSWSVATGSAEGQPLVVRFDASYKGDTIRQRRLPFRVGVALPFEHQTQPVDHDALARFEDGMAAALEARGARLVAVITQPTLREFLLYAPSIDWASEAHDALRRDFPTYSVQMIAAEDAGWLVYAGLAGA